MGNKSNIKEPGDLLKPREFFRQDWYLAPLAEVTLWDAALGHSGMVVAWFDFNVAFYYIHHLNVSVTDLRGISLACCGLKWVALCALVVTIAFCIKELSPEYACLALLLWGGGQCASASEEFFCEQSEDFREVACDIADCLRDLQTLLVEHHALLGSCERAFERPLGPMVRSYLALADRYQREAMQ